MLEESIYQIINKAEYTNLVVDREHIIRFFNEYSFNYIKKHAYIEIKKGFSIHDFLAPYNVERFKAAFAKSFRGETVKIEIHFEKESGEILYYEAIFTPLTNDDGAVVYTSVRLIELTGLKRLLKALEQSEERYKSFVGLHTSLVARIKPDNKIVYVNESMCDLFGKPEDEMVGNDFLSFIHPDDSGYVAEKVRSVLNSDSSGNIESRLITNYGIKWVSFECAAIRNDSGLVEEIQAVGRDITDSRNALHELIHTKYRLGTILNNFANILPYEIGRADSFVSSKINDLLGYDTGKLNLSNFIPDVIYGEDMEEFTSTFNAWKDKDEPGILKQKFRCVKSNGELVWVENLMTKASDSGGVFFCGVLQDITERIKTEERTFRNEALFRIIGESVRIGYYVVNYYTDEIVYINQRFCELWGIDIGLPEDGKAKMLNSYVRDLCSENVDEKKKFMENSFHYSIPQNDISFQDELKLKNGRVLRRFSSVINDSSGNYIGRFYMVEDITERMLYEKAIKSMDEYRTFVEEAVAGIIISDSSGFIKNINNTACVMLGYGKDEIIGKHLLDMIFEPELVKKPPKFLEASEGKTIIAKRYVKRKDGSVVYVESHSKKLPNGLIQAIVWEIKEEYASVNDTGVSNPFTSLLSKIKAFRHGENSLMCLNRISLFLKNKNYLESPLEGVTQEENKKLFERFELLLGEYISTVYPQIEFICANVNQILKDIPKVSVYNDISVSNEKLMLNSRALKNKLVELQSIIAKHGGIAGAKVETEHIVELARVCIVNVRLIAKVLEENFVSDVNNVAVRVFNMFRPLNSDIKFIASVDNEKSNVIFNEVELIEIFNIFIKNSIEAFRDNKMPGRDKIIEVTVNPDSDALRLIYTDTGPGLSQRMKNRIFEKGASTKGMNRGFGLYYSDSIVKKYGGTLIYDPEYHEGARFVIAFNKV